MAENLVIVESPAKAKTIERYLGDRFQVLASYGHIRDLPKSDFAIEVEDGGGCHLVYEVPGNSAKHVAALRKAAKDATTVWLAPDLDREGEAIAWHVAEVLDLDLDTTNRVTFDEITKDAILAAFQNPRRLNTALVDAQQARRAVDRIVGYRLSPVLWRTVASGISAGRVQSVALRIIVDREDEIRAFVPQEYWDFAGAFAREDDLTAGSSATLPDREPTIDAKLHDVGGKRLATPKDLDKKEDDPKALDKLLLVDSEDAATSLKARAEALDYRVAEVRRSETKRNPKPPFTTSTLQQDAANKLGFSARQTMAVAQQLYEGVRLGSGEQEGLITYMRTDSVNLSGTALRDINALVAEKYGERFTIASPRAYTSKAKGAQEAHEAIRPTVVARTPQSVRTHLKDDQFKLYDLIWKRTVATQMAQAVFDRVSADVVGTEVAGGAERSEHAQRADVAGGAERSEHAQRADDGGTPFTFRVTGQVLKFEGYLKVYREWRDEDEGGDDESSELPDLEEGQVLDLRELVTEQHFTNPPPRYTEATLVKTLEAEGIGRPSTYASIIGTIAARDYVRIESRRFFPTPLGEVVVSFMKAHFSEVVDLDFTARMESTLDEIAQGDEAWCSTVTRFLDEVDHWVKERKPERPRLPLHHPADCPECGGPMERVFSGKSKQWFASCSRWPDCEGTLPLNDDGTVGEPEPEPDPDPNVLCHECGTPMLLRSGKFGQFYGCPDYPKCKGIRNLSQRAVYLSDGAWKPFISPTDRKSHMELRTSRYGKPFVGSAGYPDDQFAIWSVPMADPCPECGAPLRPPPRNRKVPTAICTHPEIEHHFELDSFEQPSVHTIDVVPGVEAYDPEVGGEPLSGWPEPYEPIRMTFLEAKKPAPKKKAAKKKKAAAKKKSAKKASGAKKKATKKST